MSVANSMAACALASGPPALSPPSFEGHDWLYILNLFVFLAGTGVCAMLFLKLATDSVRCLLAPENSPDHDGWSSPIQLYRRIGMLWSFAFALRCFAEMQSLWRWGPLDAHGDGRGMALKRMLDPISADIGFLGLALLFLSLPGITYQLRKEPHPINMWISLPLLKRPGGLVLCYLGCAIAVVVFR
ncbi:hypothetical protein [Sphingomonas abietis]|uniref:Uncharacterized protein n=1 Tax=Sphingomonas abietis TaxID=3012344 RepID=A0ABY7NP00_9SPHN|nr:hypothetical protein [Sphingomonas abietis]WBO22312.1 hypothetical protein PBT88_19555 [Sphingomonas abietis]